MVQVSNKDASIHMGITHGEEAHWRDSISGLAQEHLARDPRQAEENGWKDLLVN